MKTHHVVYFVALVAIYVWYAFVLNANNGFEHHCMNRGELTFMLMKCLKAFFWTVMLLYARFVIAAWLL